MIMSIQLRSFSAKGKIIVWQELIKKFEVKSFCYLVNGLLFLIRSGTRSLVQIKMKTPRNKE